MLFTLNSNMYINRRRTYSSEARTKHSSQYSST